MTGAELVAYAREAMLNAYAPYSHHPVGAALLSATGDVYLGCNVENAAFGPSCCAERVALFKAISEGERGFEAIAIVGGKDGEPLSPNCTPCGVCRQVMLEFCHKDLKVILGTPDDFKVYTLEQIMPYAFTPSEL